jgi:F-type H+-transporting ATPase subunit b
MLEMLQHNTTLWVAFSFLIFVAVAVKFAGKAVIGGLDKKIAEIKAEIETAQRLKQEAQDMLADFQNKQRDAEKNALDIIEQAKASAIAVQKQAEYELNETMERREAQLADRLQRIEEKAIADIQNHAADLAMKATREIVEKTLDDKAGSKLVDQTISSVAKYLN